MRTYYILLLTSYFAVYAQAQTAQIRWDVQQDRPVAHDVYVWQGETVDLLPRLVQGIAAVAVTNAPVEFRYREASLPTNTYRYVTAAANTNSGVLAVRWIPDYDAGAAWYDWQIIVGSNAVNPRAFGRIIMRTTIGWPAATNAPAPVTLYPTRADLQAASNALASALQFAVTSTVPALIAALPESWPYASVLRGPTDYSGAANIRYSLRLTTNGVAGIWHEEARYIEGGPAWSSTLANLFLLDSDASRFLSTTNNFMQASNRTFKDDDDNTLADFQPTLFNLASSSYAGGVGWNDELGGWIWGADWQLDRMGATPTDDSIATMKDVDAAKELHADSFTNLIWRTVWSNGWCWAIAYTNTP